MSPNYCIHCRCQIMPGDHNVCVECEREIKDLFQKGKLKLPLNVKPPDSWSTPNQAMDPD